MSTRSSPLIRIVAIAGVTSAILGAGVFLGVRLALAVPGVAGGPTTNSLTFSGVLRGPGGGTFSGSTATLTFVFRKPGAGGVLSDVCRSPASTVAVSGTGAFTTSVSLENCPSTMFDGNDVAYSILQTADGGVETIAVDVAITPVPYARFADQAGVNNDCPAGYARDHDALPATITVCYRDITVAARTIHDQVVKVGTGATAFWIDRFEAVAVDELGGRSDLTGLNPNGQWTTPATRAPLFAASNAASTPTANVTWFQAATLCNAAGKRLMTRREWFAAAEGLTSVESSSNTCNVVGRSVRLTGMGDGCKSVWGVQDMIGNLWEWTDEWYASPGALTALPVGDAGIPNVFGRRVNDGVLAWPVGYGNDATWNISSFAQVDATENVAAIPAAAVRGGYWGNDAQAGVFALALFDSPSYSYSAIGFRCVVPR